MPLILSLFLCFFPFLARADVFDQRPNPFTRFVYTDLASRTLGPLCSVTKVTQGSIPCQPADLAQKGEAVFSGSLFIGDEYEIVNRYRELLDDNRSLDLVKALFKEKNRVLMEASSALSMRKGWFAASFIPLKFSYFSSVRNQANPQLALSLAQDRSFNLMAGRSLAENWSGGLRLRWVERKFIEDDFSLLEAVSNIDEVMELKKQNLIYLEPSLKYHFWSEWQGQLSLMMSNMGFADRQYESTRFTPIYDVGLGVTPPLGTRDLHLATSYRWDEKRVSSLKNFYVGGTYQFGLVTTAVSYGAEALSAGVFSNLWSLRIGLSYERQKINGIGGGEEYEDAIYSEFSYVF